MHVHILGICGTFMGGIALLARAAGHTVTGADQGVYPPMSTMLAAHGISIQEGYEQALPTPAPDMVVVGNALSRGNPAVEAVLNDGLPYTSGPQWLADHVLRDRWVLAVSGTHGKTSTASMLAWILEHAGLNPGFLIGGVPVDFGQSARLGEGPFFVLEADEYDSAFFDKRSKFVHFRPRTLVVNNLEFDHADIFPDLPAIQRQFHHQVRTVPGNGLIVANAQPSVDDMLALGAWTPVERFAGDEADWQVALLNADGSQFQVVHRGKPVAEVHWSWSGLHNAHNALAALLAARHAGVPLAAGAAALTEFRGVKRRLEWRGEAAGVSVIDDFAHHPTAIAATIAALRAQPSTGRILALIEPRSNTMRLGIHRDELAASLAEADLCFALQPPNLDWSLEEALSPLGKRARVASTVSALAEWAVAEARAGDRLLVMSNGAFGGIHERLLTALEQRERVTS